MNLSSEKKRKNEKETHINNNWENQKYKYINTQTATCIQGQGLVTASCGNESD